jgi:hypothetical protein
VCFDTAAARRRLRATRRGGAVRTELERLPAPSSGKRQSLRVIVGQGIHSSGGQPTLPRVVVAALDVACYKYFDKAGAVTVELKRAYRP